MSMLLQFLVAARLLLEKGANVNATRQGTKSALQCASQHGYKQIFHLLLKKGADINAGGEFSHSPLWYASENGHVQVVRLLLEKGTNVNTAGFLDATLKCAWENRHEQVALLLLKKGGKYQDLELQRDILYEMRPGTCVCIQGI
jgi:ankyrin repeat protein